MARQATTEVRCSDFRWFREILVRGGDLIELLEGEALSPEAQRSLRSFSAAFGDPDPAADDGVSDLLPP